MPKRIFIEPQVDLSKICAETIFEALDPQISACDFPNTCIIAQTQSAMAQIKFKLLKLADEKSECGLSGIEFATPEIFLAKALGDAKAANNFEVLGALKNVFENLNDAEAANLFPAGLSEADDFVPFAKTIQKLRKLCAEAGMSFSDMSGLCDKTLNADAQKWHELAKIEKLFLNELAKASLKDFESLLISLKNHTNLKASKIMLAGIVDAPKIFFDLLETLEKNGSDIEIIVLSKNENAFDKFGIPLPSWLENSIDIDCSGINICTDSREQAKEIAKSATENFADAAISAEEGKSSFAIRTELSALGCDSFSPEGEKLSDGDVFAFVKLLADYFKNENSQTLFSLLNSPIIINFLRINFDRETQKLRQICDKLNFEKFAAKLPQAINLCEQKDSEIFMGLQTLLKAPCASAAKKIREILYACFKIYKSPSPQFNRACEAIFEGLKELEKANARGFHFNIADSLHLLAEFSDARIFDSVRLENQIYIKNWLEIFWSSEKHLLLGDFNDGKVPEKIFGDAYLPDSLRTLAGIRNSKKRNIRDSFMLQTLLLTRPKSLAFFLPKTDFNGEPLTPSRLLLQNAPNLPQKVKHIFSSRPETKNSSFFDSSWKLKIPDANIEYLSATDFKAYIKCPFTFYLERILKMKKTDTDKEELDAMQIGSIVHSAMEKMSKNKSYKIDELFADAKKAFEEDLRKFVGDEISPAIEIQKELLYSRLWAAAECEIKHRAQGWKTIHTEKDFSSLEIEGVKIKMRIDRIDENANGDILIIDYKTTDKPKAERNKSIIESAHFKGSADDPEWKDLQMPLYREALMREFPGKNINCAYFLLPKDTDNAQIDIWPEIFEMQKSAMKCAAEIVKEIKNKNFHPSPKSELAKNYSEYFGFANAEKLEDYLEFSK